MCGFWNKRPSSYDVKKAGNRSELKGDSLNDINEDEEVHADEESKTNGGEIRHDDDAEFLAKRKSCDSAKSNADYEEINIDESVKV